MSESKVWSVMCVPSDLGRAAAADLSSAVGGGESKTGNLTFTEKLRVVLGFLMLVAGIYFGVFSTGIGVSLGFLSFIASPFVMVADK
jgi:hypothetical protein